MADLPSQYTCLTSDKLSPLPRMVSEAIKEFGVMEAPGGANNPKILGWAKECGIAGYSADAIPWCGLFMAVIAKRAGKPLPADPLWALNWSKFGDAAGQPELGDVLVFVRPGGGHVGLYVAEDGIAYHVLGGNESDAVRISRIDKHRLHAVRQPHYTVKPASARPIVVNAIGALSTDEA